MKRSLLYNSHNSAIDSMSTLAPKKKRVTKVLTMSLALTSLVDAFAIVVIYLIIGTTSGGSTDDIAKGIELPVASATDIANIGLLVQVTPKGILINDKVVAMNDLGEFLQQAQAELKASDETRSKSLVIQADKDSDFSALNPIVLMGTQSGFENIVFAAITSDEVK